MRNSTKPEICVFADDAVVSVNITQEDYAIIVTTMNFFMEISQNMNKYRNKEVTVDGLRFQSVKEASRWKELKLLERAGEITGLVRQLRIEIIPKTKLYKAVSYIPDFVYFDKREGKTIYEDVKGYKSGSAYQIFTLKKKILYWRHGIEIKEI